MADDRIQKKACELVETAKQAGKMFGFAESLTGGLISSSVVGVSGASSVFKGGIVSYTNEVKENVLGVPSEIIDTYNEVSAECAKAMAEGALSVLGTDLAISVTGIAGPTGDLPGKPVGTVYMGFSYNDSTDYRRITDAVRLNLNGDRNSIRENTVIAALDKAIELIKKGVS